MPIGPRQQFCLSVALFAFMGVLLYAHTLQVPFYLDDFGNIKENPHIRLTTLSLHALASAAFESPAATRPVANVSFGLNYLVHQYGLAGYHVVNISIHILTGIFLFLLFKSTMATPALRSRYRRATVIALCGALLWLVHPLHTQSVTYIVQRMNSMTGMFYVLALLLYVQGRLCQRNWARLVLYSSAVVSGVLALGSKQIAATLPFFIVCYEWFFFQRCSGHWLRKHKRYLIVAVLAILGIASTYLVFNPKGNIFSLYAYRDFGMVERLLTQCRVVVFYISLLLFPHPARLNLDHDFGISSSLLEPAATLGALLAIGAIFGAALWLMRKEPLISFALFWFLGNLVVESTVLPLEPVFEHRTYLPSMFPALGISAVVYQAVKSEWVTGGILCAVILLLSLWTFQRNQTWGDPISFWRDCAQKSHAKARPHSNLGLALYEDGAIDEAIEQFSIALDLDPNRFEAHDNLGLIYARQGKFDEALYHFGEALRIAPDYAKGHNNMGRVLLDQGKVDEAMKHFERALEIDPNIVPAHDNLGIVYGNKGDFAKARYHFSEAIRIDPLHASAHYNLGLVLAHEGELAEALRHFEETLRIEPSHVKARAHRDRLKQKVR